MKILRPKWLIAFALTGLLLLIVACNLAVFLKSNGNNHDSMDEIKPAKLGLVLGTSPITTTGIYNKSFYNRVRSAADLYNAGKVKKLLVSGGDYRGKETFGCDEPATMRDSLIGMGVNPKDIFMDYEGTSTIRSIAKLRNYYDYPDSIIIISQGYHNDRALVMADKYGLPATAYSAELPQSYYYRVKNYAREALARVKMVYTLYLKAPLDSSSFHSNDQESFRKFLSD